MERVSLLYCDARLGGIERWILGDPGEAMMRIPDEVKQCMCFLCVEQTQAGVQRLRYGGTAFFVSLPSADMPDTQHIYMVTAKHCIEQANQEGDLYLRVNTKAGGARLIQVTSEWYYPEDEAIDIAVLPFFGAYNDLECRPIPINMLASDDVIWTQYIGIGDPLFVVGLFSYHHGTTRNVPIARTGIIAAMPEDPLRDRNTGLEYAAYLIESKCTGMGFLESKRNTKGRWTVRVSIRAGIGACGVGSSATVS
jgi:hypothetical protein